jgi:Ca-activated chloride channel family protein
VVRINASVTDRRRGVVTGLAASQFRLYEDGKIQDVEYCGSEDAPVSIGLVLDSSRSMGGNLAALKKAAIRFVRAANPADEYLLVGLRGRPETVVPFTSDTDRVIASVERLTAQGHTALLDAMHLAVSEMRHASLPRKALVLISDGLDKHSRHSERETRGLIAAVGFPVYTMCPCAGPRGNRYAIQRLESDILESISRPTGGRHF